MTPFEAPLGDIFFSLACVGADDLPDWDGALAREIAGHFAAFAEGEIAPLDEPGDRQGCRLENGRVRMPDGFAAVYRDYAAMGWPGLTAPEAFGGQGMSAVIGAVTSEIFTGANHSLQMVTGLVPGAVRTLLAFGTEEQQARLIPALASGAMLSTMCLTEPGAGSDLSRIRCKALRDGDGDGWRIEGEKIFISGGDQDMSEDILHLVLARTSGDGVKGLSLFATTRAAAGDRIKVTRIEEKMGLHASPTCQMLFDGAPAELIGAEGGGLKAMFTMMNHARTDVALQGVAHAARACDIARRYAAGRVQGRGPDGGPVTLDGHADVARMIDAMDRQALGARALAHLCMVTMERGDDPDLVEFLTPLAKAHCTEAGIAAANTGIQVLGGYGYLREYRLEQTFRDARITAIYEGANGIHARMLATRLLGGAAGAAFAAFMERAAGDATVAALLGRWHAARERLLGHDDATALAQPFAELTAHLLLAHLWTVLQARAAEHPEPARIRRLAGAALTEARIMGEAAHALILSPSGAPSTAAPDKVRAAQA
jgi:alkylation response protein AidB-like acyl-CoA dehydrogenase